MMNTVRLILLYLCYIGLTHSFVIRKDKKHDYLLSEDSLLSLKETVFGGQSNDRCHPLTIPMCKSLGYNMTTYRPNIYNKDGPQMAARYLKYFENELCFEDLLFFACTLYNPICIENHQEPVLPCRSECRKTKRQCKDTLKKFKMEWPEELKCNGLPEHQTGVCLTRESMVAQRAPDHVNHATEEGGEKNTKKKECPLCNKLNTPPQDFKDFRKSDYAIEGQLLSKMKTASGGLRLSFLVRKAFKHGSVKIFKFGLVHLWSETQCLCPPLKFDQKYIILGFEDKNSQKLIFDDRTFIVRKTPFWKRLFLQWKRKLRQQRRLRLVAKIRRRNERKRT
ncbi:secreted frizzled-related protein 3-like [Clytia hemisphaerica]|uniref:Uncharacterized protein n=1 Tax=Clytia hemisphaerica TaxID=252671 RepID=A0A7M5XGG8_9CNID